MTEYLIQCAIFDDGDVLPTVCIMAVQEPLVANDLLELRIVTEAQYGRQAPDHALFWESLGPKP